MSKILRRPMFRGGSVSSYGTGIASGLADGGRVGFYRGGGANYLTLPEPVTSTPIGRTNAMQAPGITGITLADFFKPVSVTGQGFSDYRPGDRLRQAEREKFPMYDEFMEETEETQVPDDGITRLTSLTTEGIKIPKQKTINEADVEPDLPTSEILPEEPKLKEQRTVKQPTLKETEDNEVTMTDLERALGLGDARKEYVGDALAAASKAFFEGKGFGAISDAAAVKSKAPEIKRLAGLETYKADRAQKLYETKLKAAAEQKAGTKGPLQKDIDFIRSQAEGSQGQILALKKYGFEPDIGSEISSRRMKGGTPSLTQLGTLYFPQSFKGVVSRDATPEIDGTYIIQDGTGLLIVEGGVSRPQPF